MKLQLPKISKKEYAEQKKIFYGYFITIKNAHELLDEAKILLHNNRQERSAALAILAHEEFGKAIYLFELFFAYSNKNEYNKILSKFDDVFKKHNPKIRLAFTWSHKTRALISSEESGENHADAKRRIDKQYEDDQILAKLTNEINIGKQNCFYVNAEKDALLFKPPIKPQKKEIQKYVDRVEKDLSVCEEVCKMLLSRLKLARRRIKKRVTLIKF